MAILDSFTRKTRFSAALRAFRDIEKHYKRPLWVPDAGGGFSTIASLLEPRGHRVIVCDKTTCYERNDVLCDLEAGLPFADESFDVVVSLAVVEHLRNWERALGEFRRVGRHVILTTPSIYGQHLLELLLRLRLVHPEQVTDHKQCLTKKTLESFGFHHSYFLLGMNQLATSVKDTNK